MPNRTIYLPDDLDHVSRRVGLNLSRLTQDAIKDFLSENHESVIEARINAFSAQCQELGLAWPADYLKQQRSEAGER